MNNFEDKQVSCVDCGESFTFTAGEQEFYNERGYSTPKRCKACRDAKKNQSSKPKRDFNGFGQSKPKFDNQFNGFGQSKPKAEPKTEDDQFDDQQAA